MYVPKEKRELQGFDFLTNLHSKLVEHFKLQIDTLKPLRLAEINGYLGRIYHFDRQTIKILVNQLAEKNLCEIKKGRGIANYFVIIKRGVVVGQN